MPHCTHSLPVRAKSFLWNQAKSVPLLALSHAESGSITIGNVDAHIWHVLPALSPSSLYSMPLMIAAVVYRVAEKLHLMGEKGKDSYDSVRVNLL